MVMLSNNHVFARESGNVLPAFPPWNATIDFEKITQPPPGPVAGTLTDYEFYCFNGGGDCAAAGGQNQLNRLGNNCIDAAIADPCPDGQTILDDGDILDVGKAAAFAPGAPATPTAPIPSPSPTCGTSFDRAKLIDRFVKKSGQTTGLTCGRIINPNDSFALDGDKDFQGQFEIRALLGFGFPNGNGGALDTFSCGGDSGSLVVGVVTNEPIGLLFAGDGRACKPTSPPAPTTDANPIDIVLRRFNLHY
jgi:hypothetical protein